MPTSFSSNVASIKANTKIITEQKNENNNNN